MRTGYCLTKQLFRLGIADGPSCECGQDHIFLEYPINRDPSHDLYQSLIARGLLVSFRFRDVLANISPYIDRVPNTFMHKNNIKL